MKTALRERLRQTGENALAELAQYAVKRDTDLRSARDATLQEKLEKFTRVAASDFGYRKGAKQDGAAERTVFDRSNCSVQLVRSVRRFLLARMFKDLFGSQPWLSARPEGPHDEALANEIQKHASWKLRSANWQDEAREAMGMALDLGFVPVKTTWKQTWDVSESLENILFDPAAGEPVVAGDGSFLRPEDDTEEFDEGSQTGMPLDDAREESLEAADQPLVLPEAMPAPDSGPVRVFSKDPNIPAPHPSNGLQFHDHLVENKEKLYAGLHFSPLHWQDVTWPINASSLDLGGDCDFIGVTRDMSLEDIRAAYNPDGKDDEVEGILTRLKSGCTAPESADKKPKEELGEQEVKGSDPLNPTVKVLECWFRKRILPGGPESRIFMAIAIRDSLPLCVEYLANNSPRAQAPIHLISINQVPGRAYGRGLYETFEMAAEIIDRLINSVIVRNEVHANAIKLIEAKAFESLKTGEKLQIGPDIFVPVDLKGMNIREVIQVLELPDLDQRTWDLIQMFMQLIQVESGVTNATQGDLTNLPSNGTATGVNSLLESSSVLHQFVLEEARSGLQAALQYGIELLYFCQDADETFEYLEGNDTAIQAMTGDGSAEGQPMDGAAPGYKSGTMTVSQAQALAKFPMNVQILLSRAKRQELKDAALAALPQVEHFYTLPPALQLKMRALYVQVLRGLDIDNPDAYLPSVKDIQGAMMAQQQAEQAAAMAQAGVQQQAQPGAAPDEEEPALPANVVPDGALAA